MLILRCTQKLRKKNLGPLSEEEDSLVPVLRSWHANLVYLARSPVVVCVNDQTLLSILVPGLNFPNITTAIRGRIGVRLRRMGLPPEMISNEVDAMRVVRVEPSNSRSVLASMNDFVFNLKYYVGDKFNSDDTDALEDRLSDTPMGALKYHFPLKEAYRLFGLAKGGPEKELATDERG